MEGDDFATYWQDYHTGFEYAMNRYYSAAYGRFLTVDPFGGSAHVRNPGTFNRFSYGGGDPINRNDLAGLKDGSPEDPDPGNSGDVNCTDGAEPNGQGAYTKCGGSPLFSTTGEGDSEDDEDYDGGDGGPEDVQLAAPFAMAFARPGPVPLSAQRLTLRNAVFGASDRIFNPDCAGLFMDQADNTAANRRALSSMIQSAFDGGFVRVVNSTNNSVPAWTVPSAQLIYVQQGGAFFLTNKAMVNN